MYHGTNTFQTIRWSAQQRSAWAAKQQIQRKRTVQVGLAGQLDLVYEKVLRSGRAYRVVADVYEYWTTAGNGSLYTLEC